jgi:hypothetical protein
MDARLHADLGRAEVDRLAHAPAELLLGVLVGVGRAAPLAEAAERAADGADVRHVDVAVDDERDGLPRQLGAQLVGGLAHVLDRLGAVSANSAVSSSALSATPSRPLAIAPARGRRGSRAPRAGPSRARDEATSTAS